ncbi:MAG: hypothetical protein V4474_01695 [Patescibacteria group bacterium]
MLKVIHRAAVTAMLCPPLAILAVAAFYAIDGRADVWGEKASFLECLPSAAGRVAEFLTFGYSQEGITWLSIACVGALGAFFVTKGVSGVIKGDLAGDPIGQVWRRSTAREHTNAVMVAVLGAAAFCGIIGAFIHNHVN